MLPRRALLAAPALLLPGPAWASDGRFILTPDNTEIGFTAYAFALFPLRGAFTRFEGSATLDQANPARDVAQVRIEAASLKLPEPAVEQDVKAPHFLDVVGFPLISFVTTEVTRGAGDAISLTGKLTLRGVTRPVSLDLVVEPAGKETRFVLTTRLSRGAFGITARPVLAGDTIAISVTATLPARPPR